MEKGAVMPAYRHSPAAPSESNGLFISRRGLLGGLVGAGAGMLFRSGLRLAGTAVLPTAQPTIVALYLNDHHHEVLRDTRVRQAIVHAIDHAGAGFVALGEAAIPIGYEESSDGDNPSTHDLKRAGVLLQEAGWSRDHPGWRMSDGDAARFGLDYPADDAGSTAAAQFIARNLTDFGIVVEPQATTSTNTGRGSADLVLGEWRSEPGFNILLPAIPIYAHVGTRLATPGDG